MLDIVLKLLYFYRKIYHSDPAEVKKLKARDRQRKRREMLKENSENSKEGCHTTPKEPGCLGVNYDGDGKEETSKS